MQMKAKPVFRTISLLIAVGLFAGCSGGGTGDGGDADATTAPATADTASRVSQPAATAAADFEGTMQQLVVALDAEAISSIAGSSDLETVLALPPERVIEAVLAGKVEASMIDRSVLEIDGRLGRLQVEGDQAYTILDGERMVARVVEPETRMIMTMDPAKMRAAAARNGKGAPSVGQDVEKVGEREIRGFDATGYRFEFIGNIATAWLSEELEARTGPIFDIWSNINPLGYMLEVGEGAPVSTVMVNPESLAGGSSFMPAYTVTQFYDLAAGDIADDRFVLPEGYQQLDMSDLGRAAQ